MFILEILEYYMKCFIKYCHLLYEIFVMYTCQITVSSWLFKMLCLGLYFFCSCFSCGSTLDFDVVLVDWYDLDIVEFDVVLVDWCDFDIVDAGWW